MNGPFGARAKYNNTVALILIIICAGTLLRIYTLGAENIWYDEASGIHLASGSIKDIIKYTGITQNHPPLYFMLLHLWMRLFGDSEVAVRSLSALFGIASVPLMFYAGRLLFNRKTGLFASFLSSVSVFYIYYSQEARSYSLLLFLSLLSYLFFLKVLKGRSRGYIVAYIAATILLGYTHLFGLLLLLSQWFFILLYWQKYRRCIKQFATATLLISAALIPLIFLLGGAAAEITSNGFWIQRPQLMNILKTLYEFTGLQTLSGLLVLVYIVLAMYGLLIVQKTKGEFSLREPLTSLQDMSWNVRLHSVEEGTVLLSWLGVSILIPFVASFLMTPIYFTRYLIGASPAFYLLAARGISAVSNKRWLYVLTIVIVLVSAIGLREYYVNDLKPRWEEIVEYVQSGSSEGDIIIFYPDYKQEPFDYYYGGDITELGIDEEVPIEYVNSTLDTVVQYYDRMWFVLNWEGEEALLTGYLHQKFGADSVKQKTGISDMTVVLVEPS